MSWFRRRPAIIVKPETIRGVNLGGWLVLEKWMTPEIFRGLATDEYSLCERADESVRAKLTTHRDTFITKDDFIWLADHGVSAVRLPIGYWVFGDADPYLPTIEYVDKAFDWADATGIKILLDMHGAPASQNGKDHSGQIGTAGWHTSDVHVIKTLGVLLELTRRYKKRDSFLGMELMNEPASNRSTRRVLRRYYKAAYRMIRAECGNSPWVVINDGYDAKHWRRKLRGRRYTNVYIDTHQYQLFSDKDKQLNIDGHIAKTTKEIPKELATLRKHHPVIVGEWSLALDPGSLQDLDAAGLDAAKRAYAAAQLLAYQKTAAWFYWSYKTGKQNDWNFRYCVEQGWLPSEIK